MDKTSVAIDVQIGAQIKRARLAAGLSIEVLAQRLGCDAELISALETGADRASSVILSRLSKVLDVEIRVFFAEDRAEQVETMVCTRNCSELIEGARKNRLIARLVDLSNQHAQSLLLKPRVA